VGKKTPEVSRPGESNPEPLAEPYLNVSAHTAPITHPCRKLTERCGLECGVFTAVIDGIEPVPPPLIQLVERQQRFGIEIGEKLFAHGTEEALDLAASFGLIRRCMNDEDADGGGDARQLRRAVDLGVVQVEARGNSARRDGLPQAIEKRIEPLIEIELRARDETAGVVERGLQEHLLLTSA